ncbi:OsmC family peroxiredoxin [Microbacterium sp. NPDC089695]|uniref:OsmC family peroxiredoxin n=1 Tax=Microbacterium sp. NPDC089695 TaxID=3364198 RepID=UPI003823A833
MTIKNEAKTTWTGTLIDGSGSTTLATSNAAEFAVDWRARSEGAGPKTTPEELIAAALSTCFSMALSHALVENGTAPTRVDTVAGVDFVPGIGITGARLDVNATVPGLAERELIQIAEGVRTGCPVSQALSGVRISIEVNAA